MTQRPGPGSAVHLAFEELTPCSRFWLLNTLLGLWKLHTRTIPRLTAQLPPDRPSRSISDLDSAVAIQDGAQKELSNARWTNHKLLADLTFVCECFITFASFVWISGIQADASPQLTTLSTSLGLRSRSSA